MPTANVYILAVQLADLAAELKTLAWYRFQSAPVDDEILSKVSEASRVLDGIRDHIAEGVA